jgi:hypothetical protein
MKPFDVVVSAELPPASERNLYVSSWRHGLKDSPVGAMRKDAYRLWFNRLAEHFFGADETRLVLPPDVELLTVRRADRPTFVVSWMLVTRHADHAAIHHAYTKDDFREMGFAGLLLAHVLESESRVVHTLPLRTAYQAVAAKYEIGHEDIAQYMRKQEPHDQVRID